MGMTTGRRHLPELQVGAAELFDRRPELALERSVTAWLVAGTKASA